MKLPLSKIPSVTTAVRNLEIALADLETAEAHHRAEADKHLEAAAQATTKANAESLNADRANRIRTKLADLLA